MKKIISLIMILCIFVCGCGKKEKILTCTKGDFSNSSSSKDKVVMYYSSNGKLEKICTISTNYYDSEDVAKNVYETQLKVHASIGDDSGCKLDYKTLKCESCNDNKATLPSDKETLEKGKKVLENYGYECKEDTNE